MIAAFLGALAGFAAASIAFLLTRRRHTANVGLNLDEIPHIENSLPLLTGVSAAGIYEGNAAQIYQNGQLFDAMEADIRQANQTVHLETFVWRPGELERRFVELLCAKAQAGVKVRLLIDAIGGADATTEQMRRLCAAGVELLRYCKPRWWNVRRMNHRTHRKLLIIDGSIGYTCGHGIADSWLGDAEDKDHWRDTGVRLEGPIVHALQSVFLENWLEESKCVPEAKGCFAPLQQRGTAVAHVVSSAAGEAMSSVALLYTIAIASARREIIIQNPYFVPSWALVDLLGNMVKRGVQVHLMVPGRHTDSPLVRRAGCRLYATLLRCGVRLYEFRPSLLHQKVVIIDGAWSHVGSTNFDSRSLALNEEVGVGLLDPDVASQLKAAFAADCERSHEITLDEWMQRPWYSGAMDWLAYQMQAQL